MSETKSPGNFKIKKLKKTTFHFVGSQEFKEYFKKWDLLPTSLFTQYRYEEVFKPLVIESFLNELFNTEDFKKEIKGFFSEDQRSKFQGYEKLSVDKDSLTKLSTKTINLEFFDRLYDDSQIVNENTKKIRKCMEIYRPPVASVSDELRKFFIFPEQSSFEDIFSDDEKNEFIFNLMKSIVTGGSMNQYEDTFENYLESTKSMYKDFVCVKKDSETGELSVSSHAWKVSHMKNLFPEANKEYNFCYVSIDEGKKRVTVWYFYFRELF